MSRLWNRLRNAMAFWSAYRNVDTLTGDDLVNEQMFAHLREFAAAPSEPGPIPVGLLSEFNTSQKRAKGRKKFRFGVGTLFATIVLFPGLAYAGVLPTPVARVVQRIFNVVSVPIQIPSVTRPTANGDQTAPSSTPESTRLTSNTESQTPGAEPTDTSNADTSNGVTSSNTTEVTTSVPKLPSTTIPMPIITGTTSDDGVSSTSESSDDGELKQGTTVSGSIGESDGSTVAPQAPAPIQSTDPGTTESDDSE